MKYTCMLLPLFCCLLLNCSQPQSDAYYTLDDFAKVEKIDAHVHVNTIAADFVQQAQEDNFKLLTINLDDANEPPPMEAQQKFALHQVRANPDRIAYATTFSVRNFNDTGWRQQAMAYMKNSFDSGAIAVKIYKVIGMSLRGKNGKIVMIDDARFDPVIDYIEKNNKTVLGHLGEPKNCWLPVDKMTVNEDKKYFSQNPEYHMYLHPEFPSYEQQVAARDNMLRKHPHLRFVGAHLGSLEWSVDELAKRLDEFPNMAVDMAARISHLQYQALSNRQKVIDFIVKYQDRILYATDFGADTTANAASMKKYNHERRLNDWKFFATADTMSVSNFAGTFKGLQLPKPVIDKIYRTNAEKWYPGIGKEVMVVCE